jgi:hypothetical protein
MTSDFLRCPFLFVFVFFVFVLVFFLVLIIRFNCGSEILSS